MLCIRWITVELGFELDLEKQSGELWRADYLEGNDMDSSFRFNNKRGSSSEWDVGLGVGSCSSFGLAEGIHWALLKGWD